MHPFVENWQSDSQVVRQGEVVKWVAFDEGDVEVDIEVQAKAESELVLVPVEPRRAAVELDCRTWINTEPPALAALRGKVVLLNFWGGLSERTVAELPILQRAHETFAGQGLVIVGIYHRSISVASARESVKKYGLTFPVGLDSTEGTTAARYSISLFPTQILIGRDGRTIPVRANGNLWSTIRQAVLYGDSE